MKTGDIVRIKSEWCSRPDEKDVRYTIIEIDDLRASIAPVKWAYEIKPVERIDISKIEMCA